MDGASPTFVWLDLEMTGLDPDTCVILEVGVILTGPDLVPKAELERVVWQPEEALLRMEPIVREMHTRNGLIDRVRASTFSLRAAEQDVVALVAEHCLLGEGLLAGSSIHTDRRFLVHYMPMLERYLSYRQVDVTSLKLLARAWYPEGGTEPSKGTRAHTALADLRESIADLKHLRDNFWRPPAASGGKARR